MSEHWQGEITPEQSSLVPMVVEQTTVGNALMIFFQGYLKNVLSS